MEPAASSKNLSLGGELPLPTFHFEYDPTKVSWTRPDQSNRKTSRAAASTGVGAAKKHITRNRASYSCQTCRRRKIKCDKVHPICGGCQRTSEDCIYNEHPRLESVAPTDAIPEKIKHGTKRRKAESLSGTSSSEQLSPDSAGDTPDTSINGSIEVRLDRLSSLVEALSKGKTIGPVAEIPMSRSDLQREKDESRSQEISAKNRDGGGYSEDFIHPIPSRDQLGPYDAKSRNFSTERSLISPGSDIPTVDSVEITDPFSKLNLGYLSVQSGGRTRYVGSTFWAYISDEIDQLNNVLREQNKYNHESSNCADNHGDENECSSETSPNQGESEDSPDVNSFHRSSDHNHHQNSQPRRDCSACLSNATDKSVLLQSFDFRPSRGMKLEPGQLSGLPTEAQSYALFRCWLSGIHGHIPLCSPPLVVQKMGAFWEWYNSGGHPDKPQPEPGHIPLLYAIWYAGSVSISLKGLRTWFPGVTRAQLSAGFHDQITRSLTMVSFPKTASNTSLAAFLILQMILAKEEEPFTSSLYVSLAIRVAQTLGLHREPTLFNLDALQCETRRRLWWHIVHVDCSVAIASGLPPLINDDFFDTKMISEVKDSLLGTKEADEYEKAVENGTRPRDNPDDPITRNHTSMVSVHYVVARGKFIMARAIRRILKIHLGTKPVTKSDMQLMRKILSEVDHDLNEIIQRIPTKGIPEMGFTPYRDENGRYVVGDSDPAMAMPATDEDLRPYNMVPAKGSTGQSVRYHWTTLVAYHKWARIVLSLTIDKIYCVSYAPFLKSAKSKFWPSARQCSLRHCHGYMRKFISLVTDPAFTPFQWSWPGMHQPMHAAIIMLVDLYERPNSTEAPRSRAFIDKLFLLSGSDGGVVSGEDGVTVQRPLREGGKEAWEMLGRLREKAWLKAGLDPDVLWTEEDQIQVGIATPLTDVQKVAQSLREDGIPQEQNGVIGDAATQSDKIGGTYLMTDFMQESVQSDQRHTASEQHRDQPGRPKTIQRLSTLQRRTPFRSSNSAMANGVISNTKNDSTNTDTDTVNINVNGDASNHNAFQAPTTVPDPNMATALNDPYVDPAANASSTMAQTTINNWSSPAPDSFQALNLENGTVPTTSTTNQTQPRFKSTSTPNPYFEFTNASTPASTALAPGLPAFAPSSSSSYPPQSQQASLLTDTYLEEQAFDWDKWDAVFGQHPGFEDMMEDVAWEND